MLQKTLFPWKLQILFLVTITTKKKKNKKNYYYIINIIIILLLAAVRRRRHSAVYCYRFTQSALWVSWREMEKINKEKTAVFPFNELMMIESHRLLWLVGFSVSQASTVTVWSGVNTPNEQTPDQFTPGHHHFWNNGTDQISAGLIIDLSRV